ncbi:uncharacterized protein LOC143279744 [Babylonia areolata]|uniref:uncharacterized protein LOC143279744 n=1 Tax=Babylonia areolata TaxID=304850 RepID=UPI003FD691B7
MALDYRKNTYRPNRPDTRMRTTYGIMSEWVQGPAAVKPRRVGLPQGLLARNNPSPKFANKRPRRGHQQYVYMRNNLLPAASDPRLDERRAALDESLPVHARYTSDCGYDDFHKAYRAAKRVGPPEDFPLWGPPRLRHGRQGGSWRHVKEVLQAGGNRIVFVDGQISVKDTQDLDTVPGGHLVLSHRGPQLNRDLDAMLHKHMPSPRPMQRDGAGTDRQCGAVTAQKGMEKNNWSVIR